MNTPPIVSPQEWEAAFEQLLVKEKALTRARDALAAERRGMPRMAVEKDYRFEGPAGEVGLVDLFEGRRQLIVYRFFYEPGVSDWPDRGCGGCSFLADQVAHLAHLNARDTTLAFASRAPQADIERLKAEMGWEHIPWYTITDDFDTDFGVDEWHGTNAFIRDGDRVFRTYFVNNRGDEAMGGTWSYLDLTALGRQEEWEDSPEGYPQTPPYAWWNWHDDYGDDRPSREWSDQVQRGVEGWPEHGCSGCSLMADHVGDLSHLNARDTTLVYASRGSQQDITRIKDRMGWTIPWYTIVEESGVAFDTDFDVAEWHGTNAFIREGDQIFRTYFVNNRGDEAFGTTWSYLDITALGRQESWEDSPAGYPQTPPYEWWRWHDAYGARTAGDTEQGCDSCADR